MATMALTLLIGVVLIPKYKKEAAAGATYLDALAAEHSADYVEFLSGGAR